LRFLFSLIAMVLVPAFAVPSVSSAGPLTEHDVVRKVQAVYGKHCCFQAAFNQLTVNVAMDMKDNFEGTIYVKKPGSIALDVRTPEKQEVVINGRSYMVYFPSDGNAVTGEVPPEVNVEHFFGFFADIGNLDKNFVASFPARTFDEGENLIFLQLTDRKNPRTTYRVVLGIDQKDFIIRRAIISDALGNYNRFDLSGTTFLDSLPDSRFAIRGAKGKGLTFPLNAPAKNSDR
jgi:outer membrane lipoprotein-sorting protein